MGSRQLRKERDQWECPIDLRNATGGMPSINATCTIIFDLGNEWPSSEAEGCLGNEAPDFLIMQILRLRRTVCGLNFPTGSLTTHEAPKAKICSQVWRHLRTSARFHRATCFPSEQVSSEDRKMQSIVSLCCRLSWEGQPFQHGTRQPSPNLPLCAT